MGYDWTFWMREQREREREGGERDYFVTSNNEEWQ